MSKSRGNVVNPDEIVREYGADSLRLYEMFMGPLEATKPWSMSGVDGVRGIPRSRLAADYRSRRRASCNCILPFKMFQPTTNRAACLHKTIHAVTRDSSC